MKKFRNRLIAVGLLLFLWVSIGITFGVKEPQNSGSSSNQNHYKSDQRVPSMSETKKDNTARLVMTTRKSNPEVPQISGIEGELSAETIEWIKESWGENGAPIVRQIKTSGKLFAPAVGMMDSLLNAPGLDDPNWKPLKTSDLKSGIHMAVITHPNGQQVPQVAAYTELSLLKSSEVIHEHNAYQWLHEALYMGDSAGAVINPKTRFMKDEVKQSYLSLTSLGLAEFLGFLEINNADKQRPFHELANEAFANKKYFQVLYYWGKSYRTPRDGDDWKQAEEAKLRSYYLLNFPGSRERARGELDWMLKSHPSDKMKQLQNELDFN